jgi:hypothetical protein
MLVGKLVLLLVEKLEKLTAVELVGALVVQWVDKKVET